MNLFCADFSKNVYEHVGPIFKKKCQRLAGGLDGGVPNSVFNNKIRAYS